MSNVTSIWHCDDCGKAMVVVSQSIGDNCVAGYCTICADAVPTIHDQGAYDDVRSCPGESMVVGVRIGG